MFENLKKTLFKEIKPFNVIYNVNANKVNIEFYDAAYGRKPYAVTRDLTAEDCEELIRTLRTAIPEKKVIVEETEN